MIKKRLFVFMRASLVAAARFFAPARVYTAVLPAALVLLAAVAGCGEAANSFRFVFMTDIHVRPELEADAGYRSAIQKVNELKPEFVITGGDLVSDALAQPYGRAAQLYDLFIEISRDFDMPVYHTLGNHEIFGLYEKSGVEPDHPQYGKALYQQAMGIERTYYSFDHKGWHFVILDAVGMTAERSYIGEVDSVQLDWLERDLAGLAPGTPVAAVLHIPLVSVYEQMKHGATAAFRPSGVVTNSLQVLDILQRADLKLVLQGHLHIVEEIIYGDVHYITGGAVSGAWWRGDRDGFPEGFVVVDVDGERFDWSYQTFGWVAQIDETGE